MLDDAFAVLGLDARDPDALRCFLVLMSRSLLSRPFLLRMVATKGIAFPVNHHVRRVLVTSDVRDEIYADAAGPRVVEIARETQRREMACEFAVQQGRGLAATRVARVLGAEEDERGVGAWA